MQKTLLIGNLGNDPELRDAQGKPVCSFSMATTERWRDQQGNKQQKTEWHRIVAWNNLGSLCANLLRKGSKVYIAGKNRTRKWTDQNGVERYVTEIIATEMEVLSDPPVNSTNVSNDEPPQGFPGGDDVPF